MKIEEGKIYLTFEEKERVLDPSKPDDLKKLAEQAEKGYAFEGGQTKLKTVEDERDSLKQAISVWDTYVKNAAASEEGKKAFLAELDKVGVKITSEQKKDDDFIDDAASKKLEELSNEINAVKAENTKLQGYVYGQINESDHAKYEATYKEEDGWVKYDRAAVQKYADEKGIWNFETAYLEMNKDDIIKSRVEFETKKKQKHSDKINNVAFVDTDKGDELPPAKKVHRKYSDASKELAEKIAAGQAEPLYRT